MGRTMMKLGDYTFSVDTAAYDNLARDTAYRWVATQRPGKTPRQDYMGPGDDAITLAGVVYPTYAGGLGQVEAMRTAASAGAPLLMVDGYGKILGYWCITRVRETGRVFLPGGAPQKIEFSLELTFYGRKI